MCVSIAIVFKIALFSSSFAQSGNFEFRSDLPCVEDLPRRSDDFRENTLICVRIGDIGDWKLFS